MIIKKVPKHIAFIMDGNRRWAVAHNKKKLEGHKEGYNRLSEIGVACIKRGIEYVTVFAFSTENWSRSKSEVSYLMRLITSAFSKELTLFNREGIRLCVIGEEKNIPTKVITAIKKAVDVTKNNTKGILTIALNYGGRDEIVGAVNEFLHEHPNAKKINVKELASYLYTKHIPDPDLIIRTSGEKRLSNFLLWQAAYSELYFTDVFWPDFTTKELDRALEAYHTRERRFGG